jgi:phage portal protein BeeE
MPLRGDDHEAARRWCAAAATGATELDGTLVETKTGPAGWTGVSWSAGPMFVDWNRTRRAPAPPELVEALKQVVFACATLNANAVARTPLRLYATTRHGQHRPKCLTKAVGRRAEQRLRATPQNARWTKAADRIDEVLEHPLLQAINDVNPDWDHNALIRFSVFCLDVIGRAYWWMEPGPRGATINVWPLLAQYVLPIRDPVSSLVSSYQYFDHAYEPNELVRIRHTSLRDPYALGLAPAEAAFAYVGLADQFVSLQENLLTQGARPSLIVSNKDPAEPLGKEERARFQRDINSSLARGGTGLAWVVDGAVDVKTLTFPPADLAALQISENAVQRIANCFGVPLSLLKTEDVNLANAEAGHRQHAELAVDPRCALIASALTKWTRVEGMRLERSLKAHGHDVRLGWDRMFWAFDNPVKEDQERTARIHDVYIKDGVLTINEVRTELGYEHVDWGAEPWLSGSLSQPSDDSSGEDADDDPAGPFSAEPGDDDDSAADSGDADRVERSFSSPRVKDWRHWVRSIFKARESKRRARHGSSSNSTEGGGGHGYNPNRHPNGRFAPGPHNRRRKPKRGGHGTNQAATASEPYTRFNPTHKGSQPKPKGRGPNGGKLESHHGIQHEWAVHNLARYGYKGELAPTVTLETGKGLTHTIISNAQRKRRDERVAKGAGKWSTSIDEELRFLVQDFREAKLSDDVIRKTLHQNYRMLDKLGVKYRRPAGF